MLLHTITFFSKYVVEILRFIILNCLTKIRNSDLQIDLYETYITNNLYLQAKRKMEINSHLSYLFYLFSSQPQVHGSLSKYGNCVLGIGGGGGVGRHVLFAILFIQPVPQLLVWQWF